MNLTEVIAELEARLRGGIDPQRIEEIYAGSLAEDLPDTDARYRIIEGPVLAGPLDPLRHRFANQAVVDAARVQRNPDPSAVPRFAHKRWGTAPRHLIEIACELQ
jgi:hypothetical protein